MVAQAVQFGRVLSPIDAVQGDWLGQNVGPMLRSHLSVSRLLVGVHLRPACRWLAGICFQQALFQFSPQLV